MNCCYLSCYFCCRKKERVARGGVAGQQLQQQLRTHPQCGRVSVEPRKDSPPLSPPPLILSDEYRLDSHMMQEYWLDPLKKVADTKYRSCKDFEDSASCSRRRKMAISGPSGVNEASPLAVEVDIHGGSDADGDEGDERVLVPSATVSATVTATEQETKF